jgi:hypothetical protein
VTLEMSLKRVILLGERMKKYMVTDSVSIWLKNGMKAKSNLRKLA